MAYFLSCTSFFTIRSRYVRLPIKDPLALPFFDFLAAVILVLDQQMPSSHRLNYEKFRDSSPLVDLSLLE